MPSKRTAGTSMRPTKKDATKSDMTSTDASQEVDSQKMHDFLEQRRKRVSPLS